MLFFKMLSVSKCFSNPERRVPLKSAGPCTHSTSRLRLEICLQALIFALQITSCLNWAHAEGSTNHFASPIQRKEEPSNAASPRGPDVEKVRTIESQRAVSARRVFADAELLCEQWSAVSLARSIRKYREAAGYWHSLGNRAEEATALKAIGDVYVILSQARRALVYYNHALSLSKAAESRTLEVDALNCIGAVYVDLSQYPRTAEYCDEALKLSRELAYVRGESRALNNLGLVAYQKSDLEQAVMLLSQSLKLAIQGNDREAQADVLTNLGYCHTDLDEVRTAMTCFSQALDLWRQAKNRRGEARVLTAMALPYTWLGEMQKALDGHREAGRIFRAIGDRSNETVSLNGTGYVYFVLGQMDKSLDSYDMALKLQRALGRKAGEAVTLGHIGRIHEALGDRRKALVYYNRRLTLSHALGDRRGEALDLKDIAAVCYALGQNNRALNCASRALLLSRAAGDTRGQAYALCQIGYMRERYQEKQEALKLYEQALALVRNAEDRPAIASMSYNIARVKRDLGDLTGATENIRAALDIIESLRTKVDSPELRTSYFASTHQYYELYIDVLMYRHREDPSKGFQITALEASERARARGLLEMLHKARVEVRDGVDMNHLQRKRELQHLLDAKTERLAQLLADGQPERQTSNLKKEIVSLSSEYDEISIKLNAESPRYAALTQPRILPASDVQSLLDDDTVLLEYSLGEERSYLWAVTPSSIETYWLPKRSDIEALARGLLDILSAYYAPQVAGQLRIPSEELNSRYWQQAAKLSSMVLGPVASRLSGKRLILVDDGVLQYVPFAGLPVPEAPGDEHATQPMPMLLNYEIISLPSASVLAALRQQSVTRTATGASIAVFADPVFDKTDSRVRQLSRSQRPAKTTQPNRHATFNMRTLIRSFRSPDEKAILPRLPATRMEAEAILASATNGRFLKALDFEASSETVKRPEMGRFEILHFATHALLDSEHPELSAIVLSLVDREGKSQNGFLRLHDIYNLTLDSQLVVLSACSTALGKDVKGEGLVGMTRGFMCAGAARVIASLWKVDDDATAELMKLFYEKMLRQKQRPATALRGAQIEMWNRKQWRAPYYWASFVFCGEWR